MSADEWLCTFGPFDPGTNEPIPLEDQQLTKALRDNRPAHAKATIRATDGTEHDISVSGVPIVSGADGFTGAMIFFWPDAEPESGAAAQEPAAEATPTERPAPTP